MERAGVYKTSVHGKSAGAKGSFRRALAIFKEAAVRVPAYRDFLQKNRVNPDLVETESDFAQVPPTDKPNYFTAYRLPELSWDGTLAGAKYISSSSGSTGVPFFWPRGDVQNDIAGRIFQRIYEDIFDSKQGTTLFVDSFALGTWIAGLEFYNAAKFSADLGSTIISVTPGIEKAVAVDSVKRLAPAFDRIVLAGYPPFLKDIIESGEAAGISWHDYDVRFITGGESFSEMWRSRVLKHVGKEASLRSFVNVYGMAETGIVGHETPLSVFCRRYLNNLPKLKERLLHDGEVSAFYQYHPMWRYFEVGEDDTLMLTSNSGLPLIRYNTRDRGGILQYADVLHAAGASLDAWQGDAVDAGKWRMPFVYLYGRRDLSISLYALNIYVENIKQALETWHETHFLSGMFTMRVGNTRELDQQFEIVVELARGIEPDSVRARHIGKHIVETLKQVNSEYAKLHATVGKRALPKVKLVRHGSIETMPGRKHKWIKRT